MPPRAAPRLCSASHTVVVATEDAWHSARDTRGGALPGPSSSGSLSFDFVNKTRGFPLSPEAGPYSSSLFRSEDREAVMQREFEVNLRLWNMCGRGRIQNPKAGVSLYQIYGFQGLESKQYPMQRNKEQK